MLKLSDLGKLYQHRLEELVPDLQSKVNTTRLKQRLLAAIPDLRAETQGREVVLVFQADIGEIVKIASNYSSDETAIHLAQIIRKKFFSKQYVFDGTFKNNCQLDIAPQSLFALVRMILQDPSIISQQQSNNAMMKVSLPLSQLLMFNTKKKTSSESTPAVYHTKSRKTPVAIYNSLRIYSQTRKKELVEKVFDQGLCISFDRTLEISTQLANTVCAQFKHELCVCPTKLKKTLFTVGAVDNIDHNPSARTAKHSFHGTVISLSQFPTANNPGTDRERCSITQEFINKRTVETLPPEYMEILPSALITSQPTIPSVEEQLKAEATASLSSVEIEKDWLECVELLQGKNTLEVEDIISWAAFMPADSHLFVDQCQSPHFCPYLRSQLIQLP